MIIDNLSLSPRERIYVQWLADRQKRQLELIRRYKAMESKDTGNKETVQEEATITPLTGVLYTNSAQWLWEDFFYHGIDLTYEYHMINCPFCNGYNEEGEELEEQEEIEECNELEYSEGGEYLYGYRELTKEEVASLSEEELEKVEFSLEGAYGRKYYVPSEDTEYRAIMREDNITQIVHSDYVMRVSYCSPCYPNQGDLNTPSSNPLSPLKYHSGLYSVPYSVYAYAPPPSCYDPEYDDIELDRIITLETANRLVNYPGNREEGD